MVKDKGRKKKLSERERCQILIFDSGIGFNLESIQQAYSGFHWAEITQLIA
jgi:hypothetical protein